MTGVCSYPARLLTFALAVLLWSAIAPHDRFTWWLETIPAFIYAGALISTRRIFPLTNILYTLIAIHSVILMVGGHYTYAEVPLFNWLRDGFDLGRNYYDRLGHFAQGFVPAIIARELLIRTSPLKTGKWMFAIIVLSCLGISAAYELVEWLVAMGTGESADAFLGTQGDIWDTQKDMAMALLGALGALLFLSKAHDRALEKLGYKL